MTSFIILIAWMLAGVAAAALLVGPDGKRWAWTPIAAIFGPLWLSVAVDQRAAARGSGLSASSSASAPVMSRASS